MFEDAKKREGKKIARKVRMEALKERNIELAKQMLADGKPMDEISRYTGLSEKQIQALKKA